MVNQSRDFVQVVFKFSLAYYTQSAVLDVKRIDVKEF